MTSKDDYDMNKAYLIRLKVNRVNLIQSLRIDDDLLSNLMKQRLIFYKEASDILQGESREDKARKLVDCLITKKHQRKDWYVQFRNMLVDRNYKELVIFLDSTIINYKPKFLQKFENQVTINQDSQISNSDSQFDMSKSDDLKLIYKACSQQVKATDMSSLSEKDLDPLLDPLPTHVWNMKPNGLMNDLEKSGDQDDLGQIQSENDEFNAVRRLEALYSVYLADPESLNGSLFLDTHVAYNILNSYNIHMHSKYYKSLACKFNIDILKFLKDCLIEYFKSEKIIRLRLFKSVDDLVHKLTWTLFRNEKYDLASKILEEYLKYFDFIERYMSKLNSENNNLNQETAKSLNSLLSEKFKAYSTLLIAKLNLFEFDKSSILIEKTNALIETLNKNGQEVNTAILNYAVGAILLEEGHINESYKYLNKSLLTLNYYDEIIIDVIGSASLCYSSKWQIAKAENLALIAIQAAKYFYGKNHPKYVKALLFYCYFSNEFIQDQSSVQLAEYTLNHAKNVYGYDSIEVADASRALSKALIINKSFENEFYYECAQRAFKIAKEIFINSNAKLIAYKISYSLALQWKSVNSNIIEIKKVNINDAFNLAQQALESCVNVFGEKNIATAKIYRLIGSIFYYMERDSDSEHSNKISLEIFKSCLQPDELHFLIAKSSYGIFLKMIGKINEALAILLEVVNDMKLEELNNIVGYCKWIPSIYENIYYCYRQLNSPELAAYYQQQADNLRIISLQKGCYKHDVLSVEVFRKPPFNLHDFIKEHILK